MFEWSFCYEHGLDPNARQRLVDGVNQKIYCHKDGNGEWMVRNGSPGIDGGVTEMAGEAGVGAEVAGRRVPILKHKVSGMKKQ